MGPWPPRPELRHRRRPQGALPLLSTFFESGPALKLSYHPNDASDPFMAVKTGAGALGSPFGAAMTVSADFSLLFRHAAAGFGASPAFFLCFKHLAVGRVHPAPLDKDHCHAAFAASARCERGFRRPNEFHPRPWPPSIWKGIDDVFSGLELHERGCLCTRSPSS